MEASHGTLPKKSTDEMVQRLCHALDIARQAMDRLSTNGYTDPLEPSNHVRPEKVISETAFLVLGASLACKHEEIRKRIRKVVELLLPCARSERMLLGICVQPALALDFGQAHIYLTRLGYPDEGFDALLHQSLASSARHGRERPPHRALEQEWLLGMMDDGRAFSAREFALAARRSVLGRPMDILSGSREDVYAFTHALMYVMDSSLNRRPLPRSPRQILLEAEAALGRCLDEQDYDLGGEVLLSWPLIGKSWSAAAAFGFRVLMAVEDQAGFLPSPTTRLNRLAELSGTERTGYLLATAYHTAYVMGLLCAAALRRGEGPQIPRSRSRISRPHPILEFIDANAAQTHWRVELEQLSVSERDSLAGLLFTIALRRRAKARDFAGLRELLILGTRLSLVNCPAASQTAELLERFASAAPLLIKARRPH